MATILIVIAFWIAIALLSLLADYISRLFKKPAANRTRIESYRTPPSTVPGVAPSPQVNPPITFPSPARKPQRIYSPHEVFSKEYISYTRIRTYHECPRKFELKYLYKLDEKTGRPGEVGKLVHKIIELYFLERGNKSQRWMFSPEFSTDALKHFSSAKNSIHVSSSINKAELIPFLRNFASINEAIRASDLIHEKEVITDFEDYKLMCIIDRIDYEKDDPIRIIDYKTGSTRSVTTTQLNLYALALQPEESRPVELQYQFLKDGTTRNWAFTKRSGESAKKWVVEGVNTIKSASRFPRISSDYRCKYCGVLNHCVSYP